VKTAVILPATAASFQPVAGLPLIQRTVLSALRSGFDRVVVLGNHYNHELRRLFASDSRTQAVEISERLPQIDGISVTVIPSDRLVSAAVLARASTVSLYVQPLLLGNAGRQDLGVCRPATLAGVDLSALGAASADAVWALLDARGAQPLPLPGGVCVPIADARSATAAEKLLCAQLRADSAATDGWLAHRLDRHISLRLSLWLARHTRVRPNQITVAGTTVGLLAAVLLGRGTYWTGLAGTLLFLCATIIDGCDGEVARLKFAESAFGAKFDVITDNIVHVAIFIGLAVGLYHQDPGGHYPSLLALLLGGFACNGALSYFFLLRRPGFTRSGGTPVSFKARLRRRLLGAFEAMMNRDFTYLLVLLAVIGRLHWFLWGAAFGSYVFAILLVSVYRWRDAA